MDEVKNLTEENETLIEAKSNLINGIHLQDYERDLIVSKLDMIIKMNQESIKRYEINRQEPNYEVR